MPQGPGCTFTVCYYPVIIITKAPVHSFMCGLMVYEGLLLRTLAVNVGLYLKELASLSFQLKS